jgi:hypothetical protein
MGYTYDDVERGQLTLGGPAGVLIAGIDVPLDQFSYFDFVVMGRDLSGRSWGCRYQAAWESDSSGVLTRVGPDIIDAFRGVGAIDWGISLEVDGNGTLQFRAYGSYGGEDTRWDWRGRIIRISGPLSQPSAYEG